MVGGPLKPPESPKPPSAPTKTTLLKAKALSQFEFPVETIAVRKVAILLADGFDATAVKHLKTAIAATGAIPMIIAPRRNNIPTRGSPAG